MVVKYGKRNSNKFSFILGITALILLTLVSSDGISPKQALSQFSFPVNCTSKNNDILTNCLQNLDNDISNEEAATYNLILDTLPQSKQSTLMNFEDSYFFQSQNSFQKCENKASMNSCTRIQISSLTNHLNMLEQQCSISLCSEIANLGATSFNGKQINFNRLLSIENLGVYSADNLNDNLPKSIDLHTGTAGGEISGSIDLNLELLQYDCFGQGIGDLKGTFRGVYQPPENSQKGFAFGVLKFQSNFTNYTNDLESNGGSAYWFSAQAPGSDDMAIYIYGILPTPSQSPMIFTTSSSSRLTTPVRMISTWANTFPTPKVHSIPNKYYGATFAYTTSKGLFLGNQHFPKQSVMVSKTENGDQIYSLVVTVDKKLMSWTEYNFNVSDYQIGILDFKNNLMYSWNESQFSNQPQILNGAINFLAGHNSLYVFYGGRIIQFNESGSITQIDVKLNIQSPGVYSCFLGHLYGIIKLGNSFYLLGPWEDSPGHFFADSRDPFTLYWLDSKNYLVGVYTFSGNDGVYLTTNFNGDAILAQDNYYGGACIASNQLDESDISTSGAALGFITILDNVRISSISTNDNATLIVSSNLPADGIFCIKPSVFKPYELEGSELISLDKTYGIDPKTMDVYWAEMGPQNELAITYGKLINGKSNNEASSDLMIISKGGKQLFSLGNVDQVELLN